MRKRGQVDVTKIVIGLVLAGLVALLFFGIIIKIGGLFGEDEEQLARGNFEELGNAIDAVLQDDAIYAYKTLNFQLLEGYFVVGYDADRSVVTHTCEEERSSYKPTLCGNQACLVLYKGDAIPQDFNERDKNILAHRAFSGDVVLASSQYKGNERGMLRYENPRVSSIFIDILSRYFVVYGKCLPRGSAVPEALAVQEVLVDKFNTADGIFASVQSRLAASIGGTPPEQVFKGFSFTLDDIQRSFALRGDPLRFIDDEAAYFAFVQDKNPESAEVWYLIGESYLKLSPTARLEHLRYHVDPQDLIDPLDPSLGPRGFPFQVWRDPRNTATRNELALSAFYRALDTATTLNADSDLPLRTLLHIGELETDAQRRMAALEGFINQFPEHSNIAKARFLLGDTYQGVGRLDDALVQFRTIINQYPENEFAAQAQFRLGIVYYYLAERLRGDVASAADVPGPQRDNTILFYTYAVNALEDYIEQYYPHELMPSFAQRQPTEPGQTFEYLLDDPKFFLGMSYYRLDTQDRARTHLQDYVDSVTRRDPVLRHEGYTGEAYAYLTHLVAWDFFGEGNYRAALTVFKDGIVRDAADYNAAHFDFITNSFRDFLGQLLSATPRRQPSVDMYNTVGEAGLDLGARLRENDKLHEAIRVYAVITTYFTIARPEMDPHHYNQQILDAWKETCNTLSPSSDQTFWNNFCADIVSR